MLSCSSARLAKAMQKAPLNHMRPRIASFYIGAARRQETQINTPPTPSPTDSLSSLLLNLLPKPSNLPAEVLSNAEGSGEESLPATIPHNIRTALTIRTLMAANLHLGHSPAHWHKSTLPFIYGERNGIHIINLEHTLSHLRRAINITREVALAGGNIVFVGHKMSIHKIAVDAAARGHAFYTLEWVKGAITNKERVLRKSSGYDPEKVSQTILEEDPFGTLKSSKPKSEYARSAANNRNAQSQPESRTTFTRDSAAPTSKQPHVHSPDLLILLDYHNTMSAAREANHANIPVIAICDTDCDVRVVQYPIPGNDDSITGVELIAGALSLASKEGVERRWAEMKKAADADFEPVVGEDRWEDSVDPKEDRRKFRY